MTSPAAAHFAAEIDWADPAPSLTWTADLGGTRVERCQAVFQGALDNRAELAEVLKIDPESAAAVVAAAGYRRWGAGILDRLAGDFTLAIWDEVERRLLGAVDPLGLWPFYFATQGSRLAFASRLHPLLQLPWVGKELNQRHLVGHLVHAWSFPEDTYYRDIRQLPAGHRLEAQDGQVRVCRWWIPFQGPALPLHSTEEVLEEFAEGFRRAVRDRLNRCGPAATGVLLSGGYDSAAVAGMAGDLHRRQGLPPATLLSAITLGTDCDESEAIGQAADHARLPLERVPVAIQPIRFEQMLADLERHERPAINPFLPMFDALFDRAAALGIRNLLTGAGGDDLTMDHQYPRDLLRRPGIVNFIRSLRTISVLEKQSLWTTARRHVPEWAPRLRQGWRWVRGLWRRPAPSPSPPEWLTPEARRIALDIGPSRMPPRQGFGVEALEELWMLLEAPAFRGLWWAQEVERRGFRFGAPFQDRRLIEFVFRAPAQLLPRIFQTMQYKPLTARGLRDYLPPSYHCRVGKIVYDDYYRATLQASLYPLQDCLFGSQEWRLAGLVERPSAMALYQAMEPQTPSSSLRLAVPWRIAELELWLRQR